MIMYFVKFPEYTIEERDVVCLPKNTIQYNWWTFPNKSYVWYYFKTYDEAKKYVWNYTEGQLTYIEKSIQEYQDKRKKLIEIRYNVENLQSK